MIRGVLLVTFLATSASACERGAGEGGAPFVFVLHAGAGEAEAAVAEAAIRASPLGAAGVRTWRAKVADDACVRVTKDSLVPWLRCGEAVNTAIATCGAAGPLKVVVLSGLDFTSRSSVSEPAETAGVFVSVKGPAEAWTRDLLHELGHAFGLRDERAQLTSKAKSRAATPGPNCAATKAEADRRWGALAAAGKAGFFAGCAGNAAWLRPHEHTIMDSPRSMPEFGEVSARYLRDAARCCFGGTREGCAEAAQRDPELAACVR